VLFAFFAKEPECRAMEALIGISYAGAIALSLLVLEKSATGTEHIKEDARWNDFNGPVEECNPVGIIVLVVELFI